MNNISTKSIAAIFISIGVFVLLDLLTGIATAFGNLRITYSEPFLVFFTVAAGPVSGAIAGFVGLLIAQVQETILDWPAIICTVLNCIAIGQNTRGIRIDAGIFEKKEMIQFNRIQLFSNVMVWALIYPLLRYYLSHTPLPEAFRLGIYTCVHLVISCGLMSTLFLAIYARTRITPENFYRN